MGSQELLKGQQQIGLALKEVPHHHIGRLALKDIRVKLGVGDYVILRPGGNYVLFNFRADEAIVLLMGAADTDNISTAEQLLDAPYPKVVVQRYRYPDALYWLGRPAWQEKPMHQIRDDYPDFTIGKADFSLSIPGVDTLNATHLNIRRHKQELRIALNTHLPEHTRILDQTAIVAIVSNQFIDTKVSPLIDNQFGIDKFPRIYASSDPHATMRISKAKKLG